MRGGGGPGAAERAPDPPKANVLNRELLLSLYLPSFLLSLGTGLVTPVLPVFAKTFDVSLEVASLVVILHGVGGVVSTFPTGYALDKIGRKPVLFAGPIILAVTSLLTATAETFPQLLLYRFLAGAGAQMWQQSRLAMIADTGRARERGRQVKWMQGMQQVSHLGSPAIGGAIAAIWDIRAPFIIHGVLTLLAIAPSFKLVKETDPGRRAGRRGSTDEGTWSYVFAEMRKPQMLAFLGAQGLANISRAVSRGGLLNLYAAFTFNLGTASLGLLATANSLLGIPITFASGYIMDRWGRKKTIVPGFAILFVALGCLAATAFFNMPFEAFMVAYFLVHTAQTLTAGNMQVLGSDMAPRYARGRFMGAWRLWAEIAGELGAPLYTVIGFTLGYAAAFSTLGLTSLGTALIVGLLIRETVGNDERRDAEAAMQAAAAANATVAVGDETAPGARRS